jgi:hypothetical protein
MGDLFTRGRDDAVIAATYVYNDEESRPLYRVQRLSPKGFFQERWEGGEWKPGMRDVRRVLYHADTLADVILTETPIYVVEGEKDADNIIRKWGAFATCLLGGAGKWRPEYAEALAGRTVIVIPDNDDPGLAHAEMLRGALSGVVASFEVRYAQGKDVTEHILAGKGPDDLLASLDNDAFEPWDWESYESPETEWLFEPYVPRSARVLAFGASGSLKSLWAAWLGVKLANEGKRVAYFSLEMNRAVFAKRMRQLDLRQPKNFRVFGKFMMGASLQSAIHNFEGFDLLIVDSWSQAQGGMSANDNDAISRMDAEFFQPLIAATGATLLILDNTGKDVVTEKGKTKANTAQGASRKLDIQEVGLWFDRPDVRNNFRTTIRCQKMRLDVPSPPDVTVETPQDRIEFYEVSSGILTATPHWPGMLVTPESPTATASSAARDDATLATPATSTSTGQPEVEATPTTSADGSASSPASDTSAETSDGSTDDTPEALPYRGPNTLGGDDRAALQRAMASLGATALSSTDRRTPAGVLSEVRGGEESP